MFLRNANNKQTMGVDHHLDATLAVVIATTYAPLGTLFPTDFLTFPRTGATGAATTTAVGVVVDTATATTTVVAMVDAVMTTVRHHAATATPATTGMVESVVEEVATVATIVRHVDLLQRALATTLLLLVSLHQPAATSASHAVTTKGLRQR